MAKQRSRTVGLALGGGAARGWSHIGVIRALADMGIEPDLITGSSVGAVVGGALASGKLDDFEEWVCGLGRMDIVRLLDARISGGGLLKGSVLMRAIQKIIGKSEIEELDLAFGCVATTLGSGREIWIRSGPLIEAIRSSIALPGLFAPSPQNGEFLLDGGLVNPVPVSLARAMGADVVIAVNLNGDLLGPSHWSAQGSTGTPSNPDEREKESEDSGFAAFAARLKAKLGIQVGDYIASPQGDKLPEPGLFDVMAGAIDIMQDRITRSRMAGDPPDIHITPRLNHIGLMEFDRAAEAIDEGRKAVSRREEEIRYFFGTDNSED